VVNCFGIVRIAYECFRRNPAKGEIKMHSKKRLKSKRAGSSLVVVVVTIVILLLIGNGVLTLGLQGQLGAVRTSSDIAARSAADAGLTKALYEMNQWLGVGKWNDATLPEAMHEAPPNCDATFSYAVAPASLGNNFGVKCIGQSGSATRNVSATLRLRGLWDDAILAKEMIKLYSGTLVDGYDSSDPTVTDVPISIGTQSWNPDDITLQPGAVVDGEILYGVDMHLPEISAPALAEMGSSISAEGTSLTIEPSDSGTYTGIELLQESTKVKGTIYTYPSTLEVTGGDVVLHITGDVWLANSCEIVIREGSSLALYVEGDLVTGNSSSITNETKEAKNFRLYGIGGEDQKFELKAKTEWYGAVYAPDADITIKAGGDVYGSFICRNFANMNGEFVYYDAALRDAKRDDVGASFVVGRWHEE
jgi:hypothetical protein